MSLLFILLVLIMLVGSMPIWLPILLIFLTFRYFYRNPDKLKFLLNSARNLLTGKKCDVCNNKIIVGNDCVLKDGNMCKDCSTSLSPWFSNHSNTSVNQIIDQLDYRIENKQKIIKFNLTQPFRPISGTIGNKDTVVNVYESLKMFLINSDDSSHRTPEFIHGNPDIINFRDVESCSLEIEKNSYRTQDVTSADIDYAYSALAQGLYSDDSNSPYPSKYYYDQIIKSQKMRVYRNGSLIDNWYYGRTEEYRTKTYYDFYIFIKINKNYFDEIKFKLNFNKVYANENKYEQYKYEGQKICSTISKA